MEYIYIVLLSVLCFYIIRREYKSTKEVKEKLKRYEDK